MKRVAVVAIINDHHMLMGRRRGSGRWTNPGGHLNAGEAPLAGAVREVKEETGLELDSHLFKPVETRVVTKPSGEKLEIHGFRVDLREKQPTTMVRDPDEEVQRWQWIKIDTDLDHIKDNLHVPLGDNVLLDNILKDKPMRRHTQKFWDLAKKVGVEGSQQYLQHKERKARQEKKAVDQEALKDLGFKDVPPNSAFPKDRLRAGKRVEMEHTTKPDVAEVIAKAHLKEFPPKKGKEDYYEGLDTMEAKLKKQAFWQGFEKQAIALRPEYRAAFQGKAKNLLKKIFSGNRGIFNVHHQVHIPKETEEALSRVVKSGTKDLQSALKDVEDLKKVKPKDILLPLAAGGMALGSSLYLGQSLGKKLSKTAPAVFEQPRRGEEAMNHFWAGFYKAAEEKKSPNATQVGLAVGGATTGSLAVRESAINLAKDLAEEQAVPRTVSKVEALKKMKPGDIIFTRTVLKKHPTVLPGVPARWIETVQWLHGSPMNHAAIYSGDGKMIESPGPYKVVREKTVQKATQGYEIKVYRPTGASKKEVREALDFARKAKGTPYKSSPKLISYAVKKILGLDPSSEAAAKNIGKAGDVVCTSLVAEAYPKQFKHEAVGFNEIRNTPGMKLIARAGQAQPMTMRERLWIRGVNPTLNNLKWGLGAGLLAAGAYKGIQKLKEPKES